METIEIIGGSAAAVIAAGAYLRRGVMPAVVAYRLGRTMGQQLGSPGKVAAAFKLGYGFGRKDRHRG